MSVKSLLPAKVRASLGAAIRRKSVGEFGDLLARMERVKGDNAGILQIDKELGES